VTKSLAYGALFALAAVSPLQAQMIVDVAKVTCKQFVTYEITDARSLSLWLAGYWGGERKTTVVDVSRFRRRSNALKDYCMSHFDTPLMDAAKTVVDSTK
jgi:HdeA/HdeB family